MLKKIALYTGISALVVIGASASKLYMRYGNHDVSKIALINEPVSGQLTYTGENIQFSSKGANHYDVSFRLEGEGYRETLSLRNVDLSLFIPTVPEHVRDDAQLVRWFMSEREFNRQRVIFEANSEHIDAPYGFAGYRSDRLTISLTNNCLGAGNWELAVSAIEEDGSTRKIYQGYFEFPLGAYTAMVKDLNPNIDNYVAHHARSMEAWVGFSFNKGDTFNLDRLRKVIDNQIVEASDLADKAVMARNEQENKAELVVYNGTPWETYEELRQSDVQFHSFVSPGIYTDDSLWDADLSEIATLDHAVVKKVESPLTEGELTEIELVLLNNEGTPRRLIISGIDLEQVPQLPEKNYADGVYRPIGFGTPFTQDYEELKQQRPEQTPIFSVLLDEQDRIMNYRQDVGLNGFVLHRDEADSSILHLYPMSYERILLVGHYVIDTDSALSQTAVAIPGLPQ